MPLFNLTINNSFIFYETIVSESRNANRMNLKIMDQPAKPPSPFSVPNVRLFIAFKVFFNARFYYPVFTIMFLDFGLTMAQFALLNAIWATTIVITEVPSGAFADILGRRKLVAGAGIVMFIEILLLCIVPRGNPGLLFGAFVLNRVLSGLAEASASGADEALAFDSLKAAGLDTQWNQVLAMQMRLQAVAYIVAMSLGAMVYDPDFMQKASQWLGLEMVFTRETTLRIPLYMTLVMAGLAVITALKMKESQTFGQDECGPLETRGVSIKDAFAMTAQAGRWILNTPYALVIIGAGFLFDSIIRMVITLSSQYYRVIAVPEALFGLIGSAIAVLGLFVPRIAMLMTDRHPAWVNFLVVAAITLTGLAGMAFFVPLAGLLPALVLFSAMYLTGFFISHYLNQITDSKQRATVLSFKGLAYNLSYGLLGLLYSFLVARTRPEIVQQHPAKGSQVIENLVFMDTFIWFPWLFLAGFAIFVCFASRQLQGLDVHRQPGISKSK